MDVPIHQRMMMRRMRIGDADGGGPSGARVREVVREARQKLRSERIEMKRLAEQHVLSPESQEAVDGFERQMRRVLDLLNLSPYGRRSDLGGRRTRRWRPVRVERPGSDDERFSGGGRRRGRGRGRGRMN